MILRSFTFLYFLFSPPVLLRRCFYFRGPRRRTEYRRIIIQGTGFLFGKYFQLNRRSRNGVLSVVRPTKRRCQKLLFREGSHSTRCQAAAGSQLNTGNVGHKGIEQRLLLLLHSRMRRGNQDVQERWEGGRARLKGR